MGVQWLRAVKGLCAVARSGLSTAPRVCGAVLRVLELRVWAYGLFCGTYWVNCSVEGLELKVWVCVLFCGTYWVELPGRFARFETPAIDNSSTLPREAPTPQSPKP